MNKFEEINQQVVDSLIGAAGVSPRKRTHKLYHQGPEDTVQRMLIAVLPDSYVRPHRHPAHDKWEWLQVVSGAVTVLLFDERGMVTSKHRLQAGGDVFGLQLPPNQWHALVAIEPSVFLEIKSGPYVIETAAEFADWSAPEGSVEAPRSLQRMRSLAVGEVFNAS